MADSNLMRKWANALESGKYKQSKNNGYCKVSKSGKITQHCCLAVLDDIVGGETLVARNDETGKTNGTKGGLTKKQREKFIILNDNEGMNFKNIAKVIRADIIV